MADRSTDHRELLPVVTPLPAAADVAFDRIAALVRTVIGTPVALVSLVDQGRQVFPGAVGLPEPWQTERTTLLSHSFCQWVVARREPLVIADARLDPLLSSNLAVPDLGVVAYAGMPLHDSSGRVVGSLCAIDSEPRAWTSSELALLDDLASLCSAELQLRDAARSADHEASRARLLLELSEVLSSGTTVDQVARLVDKLARKRLGALFSGITVLDVHADELRYVDAAAFTDGPRRDRSFSVRSDMPSAIAARTRRAMFLHGVDDLAAIAPQAATAAAGTAATSFAFLPLELGDDVLGTVSLAWDTPQPFAQSDRDLLVGFARYAAGALNRATLLAERRDAAATLQHALLPVLPAIDWLQIAGVYRPANAADAVGGDWYDAFLTGPPGEDRDRAVTVVVGDVTGHDSAAAAVMGRLQSGLRHLALDAPCLPGDLLSRLDRIMTTHRTGVVDRMATAVTATVSCRAAPHDGEGSGAGTPGSEEVSFAWSNAGHLPPLLLVPGAAPRYLDAPVDPLLGLFPGIVRRTHRTVLPPGSAVLMFTDGMVERRDVHLDDGLHRLARAADVARDRPLPELLAAVVDTTLAGGHDDDTVLFGLRIPG